MSTSAGKKKRSKTKLNNTNKLALNLWDTYFQKPLEHSIKGTSISTERTNWISKEVNPGRKITRHKEEWQNQIFQDNLKKLKDGFMKLPAMKK